MNAHDRVAERTEAMNDAIYAALDALDAYAEAVRQIAAEQEASPNPNQKLIGRMRQFEGRAQAMIGIIENQVLDHLNSCNDRLFSVEMTERGEFI